MTCALLTMGTALKSKVSNVLLVGNLAPARCRSMRRRGRFGRGVVRGGRWPQASYEGLRLELPNTLHCAKSKSAATRGGISSENGCMKQQLNTNAAVPTNGRARVHGPDSTGECEHEPRPTGAANAEQGRATSPRLPFPPVEVRQRRRATHSRPLP